MAKRPNVLPKVVIQKRAVLKRKIWARCAFQNSPSTHNAGFSSFQHPKCTRLGVQYRVHLYRNDTHCKW